MFGICALSLLLSAPDEGRVQRNGMVGGEQVAQLVRGRLRES